jgi:hypothetical protein
MYATYAVDGIVDPVGDIRPGDVEVALEVEVGEAAGADSDPGSVQLFDAADATAAADVEALGGGVVGLGEGEVLHAAADDPDRGERDVPSVGPVARELLREGRGDEARLQLQRRRDCLADRHVIAVDLGAGQFVLGASACPVGASRPSRQTTPAGTPDRSPAAACRARACRPRRRSPPWRPRASYLRASRPIRSRPPRARPPRC